MTRVRPCRYYSQDCCIVNSSPGERCFGSDTDYPPSRELEEEMEDIQLPSTSEAFVAAMKLIESMMPQQPQSHRRPMEAAAPEQGRSVPSKGKLVLMSQKPWHQSLALRGTVLWSPRSKSGSNSEAESYASQRSQHQDGMVLKPGDGSPFRHALAPTMAQWPFWTSWAFQQV